MANKKVLSVRYDIPNNKIIWDYDNNTINTGGSYLIDFSLNSLFHNNGIYDRNDQYVVDSPFCTHNSSTSQNIISYKGGYSYLCDDPVVSNALHFQHSICSNENTIFLGNLNYETENSVLKYISLNNFFNNASIIYCKNVANLFSNATGTFGSPLNFYYAENISHLYNNDIPIQGFALCGPYVTNMAYSYRGTFVNSINIGKNVIDLTEAYKNCPKTSGDIIIPYGVKYMAEAFLGCGRDNYITNIDFPYTVENADNCFTNIKININQRSLSYSFYMNFNIGYNLKLINNNDLLHTLFGPNVNSLFDCFTNTFNNYGNYETRDYLHYGSIRITSPYKNLNLFKFFSNIDYFISSFSCYINCVGIDNFDNAFRGCTGFSNIYIDNLNVRSLNNTFYHAQGNLGNFPKVIINNFNKNTLLYLDDTFSSIRDINGKNFPNIFTNSIISMKETFENAIFYNIYSDINYEKNLQFLLWSGPNVINMYDTYYNCRIYGNPVCGENVINMDWTYYNTEINGKAACGNNVISLCYTYYNSKIEYANCGKNVINMTGAYFNCIYLLNCECGSNVINMPSAYANCIQINTPPAIGINVKNASYAYSNCQNLSGDPNFSLSENENINFCGCYYNCPNIYGNTVINFHTNQTNDFKGVFTGRNNLNKLNVFIKNYDTYQTFISSELFYINSTYPPAIEWNIMENGVYNEEYNIYVYSNKFNYLNTSLLRTSNFASSEDYTSIVYELQSENIYSNSFLTEGEPVTWKIEDEKLYLSTKAEHLYFPENLIDMENTFSNNFCGNFQELFYNELFDKVLIMKNIFSNFNFTGTPICGINTTDLIWTYYNQQYLTEAICGDNVINLIHTYDNCNNIIDAVCGENVLNMSYAYANCHNLTNAVCGNNVIDMAGTYSNCDKLEEPFFAFDNNGRYINKIINMHETYSHCYNLKFACYSNNTEDLSNAYAECHNINAIYSASIHCNIKNMDYAFYNCGNLSNIGFQAFEGHNCVNSLRYTYYNCPISNNVVFINNNFTSLNDINMEGCFAGRTNLFPRLNIFVKKNSIINTWLYVYSYNVFQEHIMWETAANMYYNSEYKIYVYYNY